MPAILNLIDQKCHQAKAVKDEGKRRMRAVRSRFRALCQLARDDKGQAESLSFEVQKEMPCCIEGGWVERGREPLLRGTIRNAMLC